MAEQPDIDRLADTVRDGYAEYDDDTEVMLYRSDRALDELVALARSGDAKQHPFSTGLAWAERAEAAERRLATLGDTTIGLKAIEAVCDRAEAAEARVAELERERDEANATAEEVGEELSSERVAELETALRFLEDFIIAHGLHDEMVEAGKPDALAGDGGGA